MSALPIPTIAEADQHEVDAEIARLLRQQQFTPGELFLIDVREWNEAGRAARDLVHAKVRGALSHAFDNPTPANLAAVGRAALECARWAMDEAARDTLRGAE